MSTTKLAVALAAALTVHATAFATQPSASGCGCVAIANTISGNMAVGKNGSSTSFAQNNEAASAKITAMTSNTPNYSNVSAGISGATTTDSFGKAYNISTGSGNGTASSVGSANTAVHGTVAIHGVTTGFNGGIASTQTNNQVDAGTNQGSYVVGQTMSGFNTQINYTRTVEAIGPMAGTTGGTNSAAVSVTDQKTGSVSGANSSGKIDGLNAAGYANIGAAGQFFAKAGLAASTGVVSAP
jgi:hypothetical protein